MKIAFPVAVADDGDEGGAGLIIFGSQKPPGGRLQLQGREESSAGPCARSPDDRVGTSHVEGVAAVPTQICKNVLALRQRPDHRIGETVTRYAVNRYVDLQQFLWIRHRKPAEQQRLNDGEDRRVRPDAESEGHDGYNRETRTAAQLAKAVADILQKVFQIVYSAHVAALLFDLFHSAQVAKGRVARFLQGRPFCNLLLNQFFQVEAEFVAQFLLDVPLAKERPEPKRQLVQPAHHGFSPHEACKTRPMAVESLCQLACSRSKYLRPAGVSE